MSAIVNSVTVVGPRISADCARECSCRCATSRRAAGCRRRCSSQVERGETSPTLATAGRIASGLELTLSQLLRLDEAPAAAVVRAGERPTSGSGPHRVSLLTPDLPGQRVAVAEHDLAPGERSPAPIARHEPGSREVCVVLDGRRATRGRRPDLRPRARRRRDVRLGSRAPALEPRLAARPLPIRSHRRPAPRLTGRSAKEARWHPEPPTRRSWPTTDRRRPAVHRPAPRARGHEPAGVRGTASRGPEGAHGPDRTLATADHNVPTMASCRGRSTTTCRASSSTRSTGTARSSASAATAAAIDDRGSCT